MKSIALSLILLSWSAAARAETSDQLIDRGISLREKGKDLDALALFQRAYDESKSAKALAQVALAEQALGRWIDAETHLTTALDSKDRWIAARRKPLEGALESIRERLGNLEVLGTPAGARVVVNGKQVGTLPLPAPVRVVAGEIVIDLMEDGFRPRSRTIEVKARALARETIDLVPELAVSPPPPPPPRAAPPPPPPPSPLAIETTRSGLELTPYAITAAAGAGVGVVLGVVGIVLRASFINKYNDDGVCLAGGLTREDNCGDKLDSAKHFEAMGIGGFVAGGLLAVTSLLLFVFDGQPAP